MREEDDFERERELRVVRKGELSEGDMIVFLVCIENVKRQESTKGVVGLIALLCRSRCMMLSCCR